MRNLPSSVHADVVKQIFFSAGAKKWKSLKTTEKTKQYNEWLQDPLIGGVLQQFMSLSDARLWIKDGPMKEYSRAVNGLGPYAALTEERTATFSDLIRVSLGVGWVGLPETVKGKPMRVLACKGHDTALFLWGPHRDFKHLIWAALQSYAAENHARHMICVVANFVDPVSSDKRAVDRRIADACGFELYYAEVH